MAEFTITPNAAQLAHLQKVCTPDLYSDAITDVLTRGAITGENLAKEAAPIDFNRLRGAQSHEIAAGSPPPWSKYGTIGGGNVEVYGKALDQPASRNPHYRRGPRKGNPTQGWFSNTLPKVQDAVDGFIGNAIQKIEGKWHG